MASNSKYRPVLILGAAPRISVAVARSLHRHGIPVEVASFLATEPKLRSRAIRSFHRLPRTDLHPAKFLNSGSVHLHPRKCRRIGAGGRAASLSSCSQAWAKRREGFPGTLLPYP